MPAAATPTARPKTRKKHLAPTAHELYKDPVQQAVLAGPYATNAAPGYARKRAGKFSYDNAQGRKMTDAAVLARIADFVIPSARTNVWMAQDVRAHLQVTGHDTVGRKQYRCHRAWDEIRSLTKFSRLQAFGEKLPALRQ